MEIAGYLISLAIGILLGLTGSGGSILTVPVLVYLFRIQPVIATAYSLFIVGSTSLVGSFTKYKGGQINLKTAIIFGVPSIITVFITRAFIVPAIPDKIFSIGSFSITKSLFMMILFAVLMLFASISMIRDKVKNIAEVNTPKKFNYPLILLEGTAIGIISGLVGAGGGFLIIPALILLSRMPVKQAVGTSLLIIAANSLIGFTGDLGKAAINWGFLLTITGLAIAGIFIGNMISKKIAASDLKKGFGWFVLVMGIYIIVRELIEAGGHS
jgi:uncharacterized protein